MGILNYAFFADICFILFDALEDYKFYFLFFETQQSLLILNFSSWIMCYLKICEKLLLGLLVL
jgi:hypothetical protein